MSRPRALPFVVVLTLSSPTLWFCACRGEPPNSTQSVARDVDVPGVDTRDFTPREKHEFSTYLAELPSPCPSVAVPIAQCILEKRPCPSCSAAATVVAKAVRDGLSREQVEAMYRRRFDPAAAKRISLEGSPSRGPEAAPVTVVEFADFECPFCQHIAPQLDAIWEKRKNDVRFVYKFMPLSIHSHGEIAARAAIAAQAQNRFWEMNQQLFASDGRLEMPDLERYAKALGLDVDRFRSDMQSAATKARLDSDRALADALGVHGTPTIFVDGREFEMKADLGDWIDADIAAAKAAHP